MSIIAPPPKSGVHPRQETHHYDMLRPAPYLPHNEIDALSFNRLVDISADLMAPAGEIIARPFKDHFEVLIGYDYLRAYQEAVPRGHVLINLYHYSDNEAALVALNLNHTHYNLSLLDIADAYTAALSHFSWRIADLARALNLKPSTISNRLKLTELNPDVKQLVKTNQITLEHAKMLSRLAPIDQTRLGNKVVQQGWNTRQLYKNIHPNWTPKNSSSKIDEPNITKDSDLLSLERQLEDVLASPIKLDIDKSKKYKGVLKVPFFSVSELAGLIAKIEKNTEEELRWKGEINLSIDGLDHLDDVLADLLPKDNF